MPGTRWSWLLVGLAVSACNALDKVPEKLPPGPHLVVPTDDRPAVQALRIPPPIIGGTLAVSADGQNAVVADPERDRVSVVELATQVVHEITLEEGAEPGRVIVDDANRAHVALRRAGDVLTVSLPDGSVIARRHVCAAPRGLAYDSSTDRIQVACASGELVALRASGAEGAETRIVADDLRDVVALKDGGFAVTRFKTAQILKLDQRLSVVSNTTVPNVQRDMTRTVTNVVDDGAGGTLTEGSVFNEVHDMQPQVAWRTASNGDGTLWMLHEIESNNEIVVQDEPQAESSPYGGDGFSCSGIVQTAVTRMAGDQVVGTASVQGLVLAVDLAVSPTGSALAIAQAGEADQETPRPHTEFIDSEGNNTGDSAPSAAFNPTSAVVIVRTGSVTDSGGCAPPENVPVSGQATSVTYTPSGQLLVQLREPARLVVVDDPAASSSSDQFATGEIDLGGESTFDTGHELFHRDSGAGIACAGCHAEGGDDGHVWHFSTVGARRTQAVNVGLAGTLPLHWDGDMKNLAMIMDKVFVGRMGGVHESKDRLEVLENWVFALRPAPAAVAADDAAALRGKDLFESADVGCNGCHNGDALTNNKNYDVGTEPGHELQVPSLHGVGYRAPFIHTGCATTLEGRFDPNCGGGDLHGHTSQLDQAQIGDLVAYLKSL